MKLYKKELKNQFLNSFRYKIRTADWDFGTFSAINGYF